MAAQTKSSGKDLRYNQGSPGKSGGVVEIRASGHGSEEGEDSITFPERRTRGPRCRCLVSLRRAGYRIGPAESAGGT